MKDEKVKLGVGELVPGLFVDLELSWMDHPFLFRSFKLRSQKDIDTIRGLGLRQVTVYPGRSDVPLPGPGTAPPAPPPSSRDADEGQELWAEKQEHIDKASQYRLRRQKIQRRYRESVRRVKDFSQNLQQAPANAVRDASGIIDDMAAAFEKDGNVLMNLINLSDTSFSLYHHTLNVSVLSLSLASALGYRGEQLRELGMGSILHDVGKVLVPAKILIKKTPLTSSERAVLQSHPLLGSRLAQRVQDLPRTTVEAIEKHHELLDGSGYPRGKDCTGIPLPAQIVAVTNLYDNLCNPPDPQNALTPNAALALLYAKYRGRLDGSMIETFIHTMGIYPPGSVVRLSDDSIGLVIAVDPKALLQPTILLYNPDIPSDEALMIDLRDYEELSVETVLRPEDYPERIYEYLGVSQRLGYFFEER